MIDTDKLTELAGDRWVLLGAALLVVALVVVLARKAVKRLHGTPADEVLGKLVMYGGLGWSSEAMWELATDESKLGLPLAVALPLFLIFEAALLVTTLRAERSMREQGWPGRYGKTAWGLAVGMGIVAAAASDSFAEVVFRLAIPMVVTRLWWDGMIGDTEAPDKNKSKFRILWNRMLVAVGLKTGDHESVETVSRDWLIDRMTSLEFKARFGPAAKRDKILMKLAKLSIKADPGVLDVVSHRLSLADTYLSSGVLTRVPGAVPLPVPAAVPVVPQDTSPASQDSVPGDVPAGQGAEDNDGPTEEDMIQLVASYSLQDDPDTGRRYSARRIGEILGINKNKVTEYRRKAEQRMEPEPFVIPNFFDTPADDTKINGHDLEGASA